MTDEQLKAVEAAAREFIKKINDLNALAFSTVVVTQDATAVVIGNDNPVNALAAISQGFTGQPSPVEKSNFIYANPTRH
jgi:hypothetical protein